MMPITSGKSAQFWDEVSIQRTGLANPLYSKRFTELVVSLLRRFRPLSPSEAVLPPRLSRLRLIGRFSDLN